MHPAGQVPGGFHREEGVVAVDIHAQQAGGVGHQDADGTQAHHAQGLALNLGPGELALAFFHQLAHLVPLALQGLDPVHGRGDLSGGQEQGAEHQLLDGVGVGAGGVEHHHALLGTLLHRDVVDARTGPGDGQQVFLQLHVVHGGGAHQDAVGGLDLRGEGVVFPQALGADGADLIQAQYLIQWDSSFLTCFPARISP